jgi:hypothetical protein
MVTVINACDLGASFCKKGSKTGADNTATDNNNLYF